MTAALCCGMPALLPEVLFAKDAGAGFDTWVAAFRARALAKGISDATYSAVMDGLKPDESVYAQHSKQPEFYEPLWQYLNRRASAWRIEFGKKKIQENAALFDRIEAQYGVDRFTLCGLWGNESAFGELVTDPRYMRPVIPALAALAYGEPRRRAYWEQELLNALTIIERKWSSPREMIGSWAGAMGHTQWMPEVWLRIGVDFDRDGRISPFGPPDDALAGSARYLLERGRYRRGESWGGEVTLPPSLAGQQGEGKQLTVAQWKEIGVKPVDADSLPSNDMKARLWVPAQDGPAFLLGQNFYAVRSYNPSSSYALAVTFLGDRIKGKGALTRMFPGGERALSLSEMQELQKRLTQLKYDTYYTDGRVGRETIAAVADFQRKQAVAKPNGYPGLDVLARLRQATR
jgi:membrane-bound lytic murein transglycosylase B